MEKCTQQDNSVWSYSTLITLHTSFLTLVWNINVEAGDWCSSPSWRFQCISQACFSILQCKINFGKILSELNCNTAISLLNSYLLSAWFMLKRGTWACQLSFLLFALCIEPLATRIKLENAIKSISCSKHTTKYHYMLDNVLLHIINPHRSTCAIRFHIWILFFSNTTLIGMSKLHA